MRLHDFQSRKVEQNKLNSMLDMLDKLLSIFVKLTPFAPVLGGVVLLRYLYIIGKPELFMSSIGSLNGLIAILLVGILALAVFTLELVMPIALLTYVFKERSKKSSWHPLHLTTFIPFLIFPPFMYVLGLLNNSNYFLIVLIFFVYVASVCALAPNFATIKNWLCRGWAEAKKINPCRSSKQEEIELINPTENAEQTNNLFLLAGLMWLAVMLCATPMLIIIKTAAATENSEIPLAFAFQFIVVVFALMLWKRSDWKAITFVIGTISFLTVIYLNEPLLSGTARLAGIRHNEARWYLITDKKALSILPAGMQCSPDGNYIFAASPFSFGGDKVLCSSKDKQIVFEECAVFAQSEVRLSGLLPENTRHVDQPSR